MKFDLFKRTPEQAKKYASEQGLLCEVVPNYMLFIDIDTVEQMKQFDAMIPSLYSVLGYMHKDAIKIFVNRSKSDNFHVRIDTFGKGFTIPERVGLQLMLGSDPRKEACSLKGFFRKEKDCILAFELPNYMENMIFFDPDKDTLESLDFENKLGKKKGLDMMYMLEHGFPPAPLFSKPTYSGDY